MRKIFSNYVCFSKSPNFKNRKILIKCTKICKNLPPCTDIIGIAQFLEQLPSMSWISIYDWRPKFSSSIVIGRLITNSQWCVFTRSCPMIWIWIYLYFLLKSIHFKKTVAQISFLSNCGTFNTNQNKKYHSFERNKIHTTAFLKRTNFRKTT